MTQFVLGFYVGIEIYRVSTKYTCAGRSIDHAARPLHIYTLPSACDISITRRRLQTPSSTRSVASNFGTKHGIEAGCFPFFFSLRADLRDFHRKEVFPGPNGVPSCSAQQSFLLAQVDVSIRLTSSL